MVEFTDAEAKFLTMCKMVDAPKWFQPYFDRGDYLPVQMPSFGRKDLVFVNAATIEHLPPEAFGVVAQSFAELCRERPELQPFYDRAEVAYGGFRPIGK